jgi:hypothetical protein
MLKRFLRRPSNAFVLSLCIALAIALVSVSLSTNSPFNQRPNINAEQNAGKTMQPQQNSQDSRAPIEGAGTSNRDDRPDEASEYWTILGHHLKITDVLLVLFTFALWWSTQALVIGADDTAQRQLRAYVTTAVGQSYRQGQVRNLNLEFRPIILNTGQTPAYEVYILNSMALITPAEVATYNFKIPEVSRPASLTTLGPRQDRFTHVIAIRKLTKGEIRDWITGKKLIYIYGTIYYHDAFQNPHFTNFCYSIFYWRKRGGAPIWHNVNKHYESD